jgi:ABC-type spermidine/putrescine transport system permease subunit I
MTSQVVTVSTEGSVSTRKATHAWRRSLTGPALLLPALICTILFSIVPLVYLAVVSLTDKSTFFFRNTVYTFHNYTTIWDRYLPNIETTLRLALLSSLIDLIFGYPFAYILIRKVRYRELVRTLMVFPLFGPLYLAYGLSYIFLPNGPVSPVLDFFGIPATKWLYSEPSTLFGMMMFTFPFMVMNIGAALSNVDPTLEEAAQTLGAAPWKVFLRVLFPLSYGGILAGFLMCFGWNLGVFVVPVLLGGLEQQRVISLTLYSKGMSQQDFGMASAMGIVLMVIAFAVTWVSLKFSRGALGA